MMSVKIFAFIFLAFFHFGIEAAEPLKDDIYADFPVDKQLRVKLWKYFTPNLLEFCDEDEKSPITLYSKKVGNFFGPKERDITYLTFGIGHLRASFIRGIISANGVFVKDNKEYDYDRAVRYVLMHRPDDMRLLGKSFNKIFGKDLLLKKI